MEKQKAAFVQGGASRHSHVPHGDRGTNGGDLAHAIALDGTGNVYDRRKQRLRRLDYATIKYAQETTPTPPPTATPTATSTASSTPRPTPTPRSAPSGVSAQTTERTARTARQNVADYRLSPRICL